MRVKRGVRRPACSDHPGSRVQFFGRYGVAGRERQRFRCFPVDGSSSHTFTEPLPRLLAAHGDCVECERSVAAHEGLQAPRGYWFPAREIARTLISLGQGQTYRQAAERARARLTGGQSSRHGQLAADWVEVFAPVVFAPHAPSRWPEDGTLVLDHFYFRLRRSDEAARHYFGWHVLCALAYQGGRRELVRLEAFTNATPASWRAFLGALPGAPRRIVCDAHTGMLKVIEERWPQTEVYLSEWHLRHALERLLDKIGGETAEALRPRTEAAFAGQHFWAIFEADARACGNDRLGAWFDHWSPIIAWQFARRGRADQGRARRPTHHRRPRELRQADRGRALPAPLRAEEPATPQPAIVALLLAGQSPLRRALPTRSRSVTGSREPAGVPQRRVARIADPALVPRCATPERAFAPARSRRG